MNPQTKRYLLHLVKKTIAMKLDIKTPPFESVNDPILLSECGAFVSLHLNGNLRGCIGYIVGFQALEKTIQEMALAAAFRDPRFLPLTVSEFENIKIEVSVLSPLAKIQDVKKIEVGKHGILIRRNDVQGVLLPQVAMEYGWDRVQFLEETCHKAMLPKNAWKNSETEIFVFQADVFGD